MPRPEVTPLPESVLGFDRGGPTPIYRDLAGAMEHAIRSGEIPPGARLDEETALSLQLGLSRPTVRRAIQELVGKGLLVRRRGIGTQVVPPPAVTRKFELSSLWEDLSRFGKHPASRIIVHELVDAPDDVADRLGLAPGASVLHLRRVRSADGVPIALLENYLAEAHSDLPAAELEVRGLYEVLGRRGVTIQVGHQSLSAAAADPDEAALLETERGAPLIAVTRTAFDVAGQAVETGRHLYRPDLYAFESTLIRS
jgi:DNA-binding GntR family transcriptional regulator